jgi:hypothetical protein
MIRIRPVRVEDAEGVINVLNPLIHAGESTALDRVFTADEERIFIGAFPARGVFNVTLQIIGKGTHVNNRFRLFRARTACLVHRKMA